MVNPAFRNSLIVESCRLPFGSPMFKTLPAFPFMALPSCGTRVRPISYPGIGFLANGCYNECHARCRRQKGTPVTRTEALILLAKAPVPGQVKTRLCPSFTKTEAAALYACLLEDTAAEMGRLKRVHRYLFFSPPGSGDLFRRDPFSSYEPLPQSGEDLGERMANAFETAFARGFAGAVLVGADWPVLSAPLVRAAFRELASSAGAVFGPSDDGGFYLIALSSTAPSLFRGVNWGTGSVLSEVCLQCRAAGIPYALLPPGFDIDTADDVTALARWARGHSSPACPRTRQWLTSRGEGPASAPSPGPRSRSAGRSP